MWHSKFSKRDFVEFWLGGSRKGFGKARRVSSAEGAVGDDEVHAYWKNEPRGEFFFPSVLVASQAVLDHLFTAINSSPTAPAPISAFSRIVLSSEAESYFSNEPIEFASSPIAALASISMAEAVVHSEGKITLRQVSAAACKRTLAFAWGKALTAKTEGGSFGKLAERWFESYTLINAQTPSANTHNTISAEIGALKAYANISVGLAPSSEAGNLAYAIHRQHRGELSSFWSRLSTAYGFDVSLETLSQANREERGSYLQRALILASSSADETIAAICAFIATQVAPGSLEHLDLLRQSGNPTIVFWYALYAALQSPNEILAAQGGLGYRVYRDIAQGEDRLSPPTADIGFEELKALERIGLDSFSKKFGHVAEVEVELIPLVISSFSYGSRQARASRQEFSAQAHYENDHYAAAKIGYAYRAKLEQAIGLLSQLASEIPDGPDGGDGMFANPSSRRYTKKKI